MKISYKEFLEKNGIISEKEYNELMDSLPDLDFNKDNPGKFVDGLSDPTDVDDITYEYIDCILPEPLWLFEMNGKELELAIDSVHFDKEKVLEHLKIIAAEFKKKGYTISNYDEIVNDVYNEYDNKKTNLSDNEITNFINSLSFEDKIKFHNLLKEEIYS